ncbi:FAD:protein FMN transferase [Chitinophagaceae bacterium LB-8]|uniref:FAD:protein FMN transferase n=1 Tax=Paraflavisolibacter caeni TaxID=2982496 RepID=A0A9X2XT25_9BACT|nr:FAD:protein FMN transferase [Paraflavisolibacter caeni]MCU7548005.1 FAD:protein FMN transferase [Paraflavisolibacter caeni]
MHPADSSLSLETAHKKVLRLMGNRFEITVVHNDASWANERIDEAVTEISRIEKLLTTFNEESQTALINRNAGITPVKVDREVFDLVYRSLKISKLTQGAFDITYGSVDKSLWNFDASMTALPDKETARQMVRLINWRNVILDEANCTVFLKEKGMRIGFGGIGKGYAADKAKEILMRNGVQSGVVNAAGDLITWGGQPNGSPWTVGIADPDTKHPFSYLNISNMAVATSGNYEKFAIIDGKRYSHTIDPKTGMPVSGIKSVTIICSSAELADAMATPVMVMGIRAGLNMINQLHGVACIIIDDDNKMYTTHNIKIS